MKFCVNCSIAAVSFRELSARAWMSQRHLNYLYQVPNAYCQSIYFAKLCFAGQCSLIDCDRTDEKLAQLNEAFSTSVEAEVLTAGHHQSIESHLIYFCHGSRDSQIVAKDCFFAVQAPHQCVS